MTMTIKKYLDEEITHALLDYYTRKDVETMVYDGARFAHMETDMLYKHNIIELPTQKTNRMYSSACEYTKMILQDSVDAVNDYIEKTGKKTTCSYVKATDEELNKFLIQKYTINGESKI
tara:strand:- start:31778 stop:32134 length:357 start_codon:yes stop_codon:yes gene_type:complete